MRLLIKRDRNWLESAQGNVEVDSDVPVWLRAPRVVKQESVATMEQRNNDDLVLAGNSDAGHMNTHLGLASRLSTSVHFDLPGVWSGYRSVLVSDGNGGLYRLKGVSLNPEKPHVQKFSDGSWEVFGGQLKYSAEFEKQYSDKFNRVLSEAGIEPVMTCKGFWHYPIKVRRNPLSASVVQVEGDTRLDEFMFLAEQYFLYRVRGVNGTDGAIRINSEGNRLAKNLELLYKDIGFVVGGMKALMDKNYQTWSSTRERSNAHIGNVVLYNGTDKVKIGFVDFDASCDTEDFSKSKLRAIQKKEYETIKNSAMKGVPISMRRIMAKFFDFKEGENQMCLTLPRQAFVQGFESGYGIASKFNVTELKNSIDFGRFLEIFEVLRSGVPLVPAHRFASISEEPFYREDKRRIDDLYGILGRNREYQEDISNSFISRGNKGLEEIIYKGKFNDSDSNLCGLGN